MVGGSFGAFSSLAGWTIVPDFATRQLLKIIHRLLQNHSRFRTPPPGSPTYRQHYAYTFAVVVLGYLLYNMVQSAMAMPPNFYEILDVTSFVDEQGLKAAFRQFAKKYHPDRPGVGPEGEAQFMAMRDAYEALKDPVKRFAYDRFGPDVLSWKDCSTPREYLYRGLLQASGYHIAIGAGLLFWSAIGQPSPVAFWRFTLFALVLALESALLVGPSVGPSSLFATSALTRLFPQRVAYQHILFLHQLFMFFSVALSRVAPQFTTPSNITQTTYDSLQGISGMIDREASILVHTHLQSIHPDLDVSTSPSPASTPSSRSQSHLSPPPSARASLAKMLPLTRPSHQILSSLTKEMEELVIETNVKKDSGPLKMAWENAVRKLSWGGPGPAKRRGGENGHGPTPKGSSPKANWWETTIVPKTEDGDYINVENSSPMRGNGAPANNDSMLPSPISDQGVGGDGSDGKQTFPTRNMGNIAAASSSRTLFSQGNAWQFRKAGGGGDGQGYVRGRSVSY